MFIFGIVVIVMVIKAFGHKDHTVSLRVHVALLFILGPLGGSDMVTVGPYIRSGNMEALVEPHIP